MNAILSERLNYELLMLEQKRKEFSLRLEQVGNYDGTILRRVKSRNNYYYCIKRPRDTSYSYIGRESHREVSRICEARFLEEASKRVENNIELINALINNYQSLDIDHINENLPKTYRFEPQPVAERHQSPNAKWLAQNLEFQRRFPENYPENKRHRTSDGVLVKTISEALIYERFKDAGLTVIYELPFLPDDHGPAIYPDFAVLSPIDLESVIFVEFVGRMDLQQYREGFAKKVGRFIDSGYIPGVNLFFIFSDRDGSIDSLQITKLRADIYGLRNTQLS